MSTRITPERSTAEIWAAHELAEREAGDDATAALLFARRTVAERRPGCARAILNPDPALNWDRGQLVTAEIAKWPENARKGR